MKREKQPRQVEAEPEVKLAADPEETPVAAAAEESAMSYFEEAAEVHIDEGPSFPLDDLCGIGGCTTSYEDPRTMQRHRERMHNVPSARNLNQPLARNPQVKLA